MVAPSGQEEIDRETSNREIVPFLFFSLKTWQNASNVSGRFSVCLDLLEQVFSGLFPETA